MGEKQRSEHTIMVVEDYEDTRVLLRQALETIGYRVLEAINGQEAVDIAEREQAVPHSQLKVLVAA